MPGHLEASASSGLGSYKAFLALKMHAPGLEMVTVSFEAHRSTSCAITACLCDVICAVNPRAGLRASAGAGFQRVPGHLEPPASYGLSSHKGFRALKMQAPGLETVTFTFATDHSTSCAITA